MKKAQGLPMKYIAIILIVLVGLAFIIIWATGIVPSLTGSSKGIQNISNGSAEEAKTDMFMFF